MIKGDFIENVREILFEGRPWPFAEADGCYWPGVSGPGRGNSRGRSTDPHCTGTGGTGEQTQAWGFTCGYGGNSLFTWCAPVWLTHTVQTGVALLHLLPAPLPLSLQLSLLLLQVGLQLRNAFAQTVLIQQTVRVLQLQAVSTVQGLIRGWEKKRPGC